MTQPVKPDEIELMRAVAAHDGRVPYELWETLTKRQYYILSKWTWPKGWWEYGVSLRGGWLTDKGRAHFETMTGVTLEPRVFPRSTS